MELIQVSTRHSPLTHALKEWAIAVEALVRGETILLLRKGGIREDNNRFSLVFDRASPHAPSPVWLYPTYEHQKPQLLKPDYASQVEPVASGWHPPSVSIAAFANITDIFQVSDAATLSALLPFHVWNEQFVVDRLRWKPRQPICVLLLRVQRVAVQTIPYRSEYGGCKSWIDLEPLPMDSATSVLSDEAYEKKAGEIRQIIQSGSD